MALKKLCGCNGCIEMINIGSTYCDKHQAEYEAKQKERYSNYNKNRTDNKEIAFYKSKAWLLIRQKALIRDNGLCQHCLKDNKITYAELVHHMVEVKEDWNKRLDIDNLISLCESCHQAEHADKG